MPVKQLRQNRSADYGTLVQELAAEWKASASAPGSRQPEPVILLETDRAGHPVHVYVVWSKWEHVDRVERSEIIMDAAEAALAPSATANITIAMGLTQAEAQQMGIQS